MTLLNFFIYNGRLIVKRFFITIFILFNVSFSSDSNAIPFFTDHEEMAKYGVEFYFYPKVPLSRKNFF